MTGPRFQNRSEPKPVSVLPPLGGNRYQNHSTEPFNERRIEIPRR